MENHYDRHTYTDIGTLLLNTYEQTFLEYEREHPQDLNIIASDVREIAAATRAARERAAPRRARETTRRRSRAKASRGEPPNALGWVECDACRVLTHVDCARAGAADLTPGERRVVRSATRATRRRTGTRDERRRRTSRRRTSRGRRTRGTRSVGAGVEKRRKRSRDDVRSRRPAPRSIGDDVRPPASAAAAAAAAAADGRRTFDPRLAEAATRFVAEDAARRRTGAKPGAVDAVLGTAGFGTARRRWRRGGREDAVMVPRARLAPLERRRRTPRRAGRKSASRVRPAGPEREPDAEALGGGRAEIGQSVFAGRVRDTLDVDASASSPLGPAA